MNGLRNVMLKMYVLVLSVIFSLTLKVFSYYIDIHNTVVINGLKYSCICLRSIQEKSVTK